MPHHSPHLRSLPGLFTVLALGSVLALLALALLVSGCGSRAATTTATTVRTALPTPTEVPTTHAYTLTTARTARWAVVPRATRAYSRPSTSAHVVTTLSKVTGDGTENLVLVLGEVVFPGSRLWYHIRLAILPNNSTAWVPSAALGRLYTVNTHLYVDLEKTTATLTRNGKTIFKTIVGVGRPHSPTPRGQFYIRDKLTHFNNPYYGPVAFGTSARSATLTDWPDGGFIGVHGTDSPQILPGRVSHGCVRLPNASILALARLMPVGTPVTIA